MQVLKKKLRTVGATDYDVGMDRCSKMSHRNPTAPRLASPLPPPLLEVKIA